MSADFIFFALRSLFSSDPPSSGPVSVNWGTGGIDVVVYDAAGAQVGAITHVVEPWIEEVVGELKVMSWLAPRSDAGVALATIGREVAIRREGEGFICRGKVVKREKRIDKDGGALVAFSCLSLGVELLKRSTYMGIVIDSQTPGGAIDEVLSGTGWTKLFAGGTPVAIVNQATANLSASSSLALSNFAISGEDRLLIVDVAHVADDAGPHVDSPTFGGTPLTKLLEHKRATGNQRIERWFMIDPPVGTTDDVAGSLSGVNQMESQVAASADDAFENATVVTLTGIQALADDVDEWVGVRFPGVALLQGVTIVEAHLEFVLDATGDNPDVDIWANDVDNAAAFTTGASNISGRVKTTATVAWDTAALGGDGATFFPTPDLTAIVQEIVNRVSWASGNAMAFMIQAGADSARDFAPIFWDGDANLAPKLIVAYQETPNTVAAGIVAAYCLTGVDQDAPFRGYNKADGSSTTPSVTPATQHGDFVLDGVVTGDLSSATPNDSHTEETDVEHSAGGSTLRLLGSTADADDTTLPMEWTISPSGNWTSIASVIRAKDTISQRLDNMSLWQAMQVIAQIRNGYLRETDTLRQLELVTTPADSGIVLINAAEARAAGATEEGSSVGLIEALLSETEEDVVNRIVPLGANEGNIVFDVSLADRTSPYTIQSFIPNRPSVTNTLLATLTPDPVSPAAEPEFRSTRAGVLNMTGSNKAIAVLVHVTGINATTAQLTINVGGIELANPQLRGTAGVTGFIGAYVGYGIPAGSVTIEVKNRMSDDAVTITLFAVAVQDAKQLPLDAITGADNGALTSAPNVTLAAVASDLRIGALCGSTDVVATTVASGTDQQNLLVDEQLIVDSKSGGDNTIDWAFSFSRIWDVVAVQFFGAPLYYIEDATSISNYGLSEETIIEAASKFVGSTAAQRLVAANTLYDLNATRLGRKKDPPKSWAFAVSYLPKGPLEWLVGDTLRAIYRDEDEEIDETLYCVRRRQEFPDGVRRWTLTLSTVPALPRSEEDLLLEQLRRLMALEGA